MTAIASVFKTQPQPFRFLPYTEWVILAGCGAMAAIAIPADALASTFTPDPLYDQAGQYTTTIAADNTPADIYFPSLVNPAAPTPFPVALLLQGALVDKSFYSGYASLVARYGFIVVVPNNLRPSPIPGIPTALLPETSQVGAVLSHLTAENANPASPIAGQVDTQKLGLLGHSFGAAVGLSAITNQCLAFLCREPFTRPPQLLAGAFFGANLRDQITGEPVAIDNAGIGVALLQGDRDGVALPARAAQTYDDIQTPPRVLLTIAGVNHFGITNVNNPSGAQPDLIPPTLDQSIAVETTARWSALFLRSSLLNDPVAFDYIFSTGDALDPNVSVTQSEAIPEPISTIGWLMFGVASSVYQWKKRRAIVKR